MKEIKVIKEIPEKRTSDSKEYLLADGRHRIVQTILPATARSATTLNGLELENFQIENYMEMFNARPDPLDEYTIGAYGYGMVGLALRAKFTNPVTANMTGIRDLLTQK